MQGVESVLRVIATATVKETGTPEREPQEYSRYMAGEKGFRVQGYQYDCMRNDRGRHGMEVKLLRNRTAVLCPPRTGTATPGAVQLQS